MLQQYLPFTVLKLFRGRIVKYANPKVATVPTVYGIETQSYLRLVSYIKSCNSTYRLRY